MMEPVSDDVRLLKMWSDGDREAGKRLFDRYYDRIQGFFSSKVDVCDADDLVQETFLACTSGRERIRSSFRAYLFGIAHNLLKKFLRAKYNLSDEVLSVRSARDLAPGITTMARATEEKKILLAALQSLPLDEQIVVELTHWEEMTSDDIGSVIGRTGGAVRALRKQARDRLRDILQSGTAPTKQAQRVLKEFEAWAEAIRTRVRD